MGYGDELMAAGEARRARRADPRKVTILDRFGQPRWHTLWEGNSHIARPGEADTQTIVNGPGARPYIDYPATLALGRANGCAGDFKAVLKAAGRWIFRKYKPEPADLPGIERKSQGYVIVEPHFKPAAMNKDWGWHRWQELVNLDRSIDWIQVGPKKTRLLDGVRLVETANFMDACKILSGARACALPEGGLHHAAAAVGIPAAVMYGGFTSPEQTGYDLHRNLFIGIEPCGMRTACRHCAEAMAAITPQFVFETLEGILANT